MELRLNDDERILGFISRFNSGDTSKVFTNGCCYWFAFMLCERFRGLNPCMMYDITNNHFATKISGKVYDVTGDVTNDGQWQPWVSVMQEEPYLAGRIISDCILF